MTSYEYYCTSCIHMDIIRAEATERPSSTTCTQCGDQSMYRLTPPTLEFYHTRHPGNGRRIIKFYMTRKEREIK